ncbi:hypothetical protein L1987_49328 [Smallanthus sonchifolius]|uniref:Uncharacterized protein n=1 Tax=Smallanthus sonchifolius TaxID=185202 RepID=A0ACB9FVC6_9ASTR|nr:hypothetical protein L1987_49328 [Smallanthus sonchifolius]
MVYPLVLCVEKFINFSAANLMIPPSTDFRHNPRPRSPFVAGGDGLKSGSLFGRKGSLGALLMKMKSDDGRNKEMVEGRVMRSGVHKMNGALIPKQCRWFLLFAY